MKPKLNKQTRIEHRNGQWYVYFMYDLGFVPNKKEELVVVRQTEIEAIRFEKKFREKNGIERPKKTSGDN